MNNFLGAFIYQSQKRLAKQFLDKQLKNEFLRQRFNPNERLIEYHFLLESLLSIWPKSILDIGTGHSSLAHLLSLMGFKVKAIDNVKDYWTKELFNRHFYLINDDIVKTKLKKKFDFISCISTLEHIKDCQKAVKNIFKLLKPKGHVVFTFPYNEKKYLENVYKEPQATFGKHVNYPCRIFSRQDLNFWQKQYQAKIIKQEYWQCWKGDFWTFSQIKHPPLPVSKKEKHQLTCLLIKKL